MKTNGTEKQFSEIKTTIPYAALKDIPLYTVYDKCSLPNVTLRTQEERSVNLAKISFTIYNQQMKNQS